MLLLILLNLVSPASAQTQCDLENIYMLGDIAIPSIVDSEPMYMDDYSKVLTTEERQAETHSRSRRAAVRDRSRIWPDNTVPYVIDSDFSDYYVTLLQRAMNTWEEATCVKFVPHTTQGDYIRIRQGRRCCSYVGRQRRGEQKMALDPGCMQHGILLHELGHVLGFWHEQNRPDRDQYIKVIKNYHHSVRYNFQKLNESQVDDYGIPYDYNSIMHYGRTFFSTDGKSTTLLPLEDDVEIGQRLKLSPLDVLQANKLYMCQKDCSWTYNASESAGSIRSINYPDNYPPKTDCIAKILASEGQVIRLNFERIDVEHHSDCIYDYLEVRDGNMPTSPLLGKFCGDLPPRNFTSSGHALWVKFHSDSSVSKSGFFAHYTAFDKGKTKVTKIDPCDLKTCAHDCEVINDEAECTCPRGFYLNDDGFSCRDYNECQHNNGGCSHICLNSQGSFTCLCPRGYILGDNNRTCIDIDECSGVSRCSQLCINTPGSYYCSCMNGYRLLNDYTTCEDKNECLVRNGGCQQECHNFVGTYSCRCRAGYQLSTDGVSCLDIDECLYDNGACEHLCENLIGSHRCACEAGFAIDQSLDQPGTRCRDIDECGVGNGACEQTCVNTPGSHHCTCESGFTVEGAECSDVNECQDGRNGGCQDLCANVPGGRECSCGPGYTLSNSTHCQDDDECSDSPCEMGCVNEPGSYHCTCFENFVLDNDHHTCIVGLSNAVEENSVEDAAALVLGSVSDVLEDFVDDSNHPGCGNSILRESGVIDSPRYPYNYPNNIKCSWVIAGRPNERVQVTFTAFDLEEYNYCRYDSLRMYDGATEAAPYLANLCGKLRTRLTVSSTGPTMLLKFTSDMMYSRPGFIALVDMTRDTCGGRYYTTRQSRELSWRSRRESQCMWTITGTESRNILLNFIKFKMFGAREGRGRSCPLDASLEVYSTTERTLLGRYCRSNPPPKLLLVPSHQVTIVARAMSTTNNIDVLLLHSSTRMATT